MRLQMGSVFACPAPVRWVLHIVYHKFSAYYMGLGEMFQAVKQNLKETLHAEHIVLSLKCKGTFTAVFTEKRWHICRTELSSCARKRD